MTLNITADKNSVITVSLIIILLLLYIGFSYYMNSIRLIAMKQVGKDIADVNQEFIKKERVLDNREKVDDQKVKRKYRKRKK